MRKLICKLYNNSIIRYVFFGGLTTLVNLLCFYMFAEVLQWNVNLSNTISVCAAIVFAYFVNSRFVFSSAAKSVKNRFCEFVKFIGARLLTMGIEVGGVFLMVDIMRIDKMISKLALQVIVLVTNYVLSKLLVFVNHQEKVSKNIR